MEYFGPHLMLDITGCKEEQLTNCNLIYKILNELPDTMKMTKMTLPYVVKWLDKGSSIEGLSGFVMIAESHLSIHTFPQNGFAAMDIFSCKPFDKNVILEYLKGKLDGSKINVHFVMRGEGASITIRNEKDNV